jgi:hypothetical protein
MLSSNPDTSIAIKPHSHKKLAAVYQVSPKVLSSWVKPYPQLAMNNRKQYNLEQMLFIVEKFGWPLQLH